MIDGNEFRRRVESISDTPTRIMMAHIYEAIMEVTRQHDEIVRTQVALAKTLQTMSGFADILATDMKALKRIMAANEKVKSVPLTQDED